MKHLLLAMLLLWYGGAVAQNYKVQNSNPLTITEVMVVDNALGIASSRDARNITIITEQQIKDSGARSINDAIAFFCNADVKTRGVNGVQSDISIRGGSFDQVLVLINGYRLNDPQTGHHLMNIPVALQDIQRIELIKGSSNRNYGQTAMTATINIITKQSKSNASNASVSFGQYQSFDAAFNTKFGNEQNQHSLALSTQNSNGYRYNTDYAIHNANYSWQHNINNGNKLNLYAGATLRKFGANGFYASPLYTNQYEKIHTTLMGASVQQRLGTWNIQHNIQWRYNYDHYIFIRKNPSYYQNKHYNNNAGYDVKLSKFSRYGTTQLGFNVFSENINSTRLGKHERYYSSILLSQQSYLFNNKLSINPSVNFTYYSDFSALALAKEVPLRFGIGKSQIFYQPGLDLAYFLTQNISLYANGGYTYRTPTYTDLYYSDPANLGNENLLPEYAFNYEGGIKLQRMSSQLQLSYFDRTVLNQIDYTKTELQTQWQATNINELHLQGIEADLRINFYKERLLRYIPLKYLQISASHFLPNNNQVLLAENSKYVLNYKKWQINSNLHCLIRNKIGINLNYLYAEPINQKAYHVLGGKVHYQWEKARIFGQLQNITQTQYSTSSLIPMPKQWWWLGLETDF